MTMKRTHLLFWVILLIGVLVLGLKLITENGWGAKPSQQHSHSTPSANAQKGFCYLIDEWLILLYHSFKSLRQWKTYHKKCSRF